METPLVSICCLAYNHAQFIRKCLDGFLMQQTDFPIEILIHDDCSTDGTIEIIQEYTAKYPDLIFPLYEDENQYSRGGAGKMDLYNYRRARGKYIAYCEGDDYWTDPLKLQKQVDFMEANSDYSVCFHNFEIYDIRNNETCCSLGNDLDNKELGIDISSHMFLQHSSLGQPLTMLYRKSMFDFRWSKQYRYYRDTHEIYHLLMVGKGMFLNFVGATHIQHNTGVSAKLDIQNRALVACKIFNELYTCNTNDCKLKKIYIDTLLWTHSILFKWSFVKLLYKVFFNCPSVSLSVLYTLIKRNFKHYISR